MYCGRSAVAPSSSACWAALATRGHHPTRTQISGHRSTRRKLCRPTRSHRSPASRCWDGAQCPLPRIETLSPLKKVHLSSSRTLIAAYPLALPERSSSPRSQAHYRRTETCTTMATGRPRTTLTRPTRTKENTRSSSRKTSRVGRSREPLDTPPRPRRRLKGPLCLLYLPKVTSSAATGWEASTGRHQLIIDKLRIRTCLRMVRSIRMCWVRVSAATLDTVTLTTRRAMAIVSAYHSPLVSSLTSHSQRPCSLAHVSSRTGPLAWRLPPAQADPEHVQADRTEYAGCLAQEKRKPELEQP